MSPRTYLMGVLALSLCVVANVAPAATVLKIDLGESGTGSTDVQFAGGALGTTNDGIGSTAGEQNSSLTFVDFLDSIASDVISGASVTISQIQASGSAMQSGSTVMQGTAGGNFQVFDASDVLLLSGTLDQGVLIGGIGLSSGSFLTTSPVEFTGGSLLPFLDPASGSFGLSLNGIQTGGTTGLVVSSGSLLGFSASATGQIGALPASAATVPEVSSLLGAFAGLGGWLAVRSCRRMRIRRRRAPSDGR